jgi:hypothetical protein
MSCPSLTYVRPPGAILHPAVPWRSGRHRHRYRDASSSVLGIETQCIGGKCECREDIWVTAEMCAQAAFAHSTTAAHTSAEAAGE